MREGEKGERERAKLITRQKQLNDAHFRGKGGREMSISTRSSLQKNCYEAFPYQARPI